MHALLRPRHRYSFADYLTLCADSTVRLALWDGHIYAMTGGTIEHSRPFAPHRQLVGSATVAQLHGPRVEHTHTTALRATARTMQTPCWCAAIWSITPPTRSAG